ncbi:hypothetical protein HPB48_023489 [Haemaphysalis longicornis]|uniref:Small ribosomal subunit protein mS26 n=1 Tax=Haemaphysalis longicornis TaxID=44386 RepID=A0A9J6GWL2_HAELO|nr:hypothetical protein HPB48_023489 [Haemaphysalis longicornis]
MLRSSFSKVTLMRINNATQDAIHQRADVALLPGLHQVRWKQPRGMKPRWMPMAPTKLFKINLGPPKDFEEIKLLQQMHAAYRTEMKAIRANGVRCFGVCEFFRFTPQNFWKEQNQRDLELADKDSLCRRRRSGNTNACLKKNEKENQRVAKLSGTKRKRRRWCRSSSRGKLTPRPDRGTQGTVEEIVRAEKERSSTYVTLENLDEAIEFAIENPVSYSYAIDAQGKEIWGRGRHTTRCTHRGPAPAHPLPFRKNF